MGDFLKEYLDDKYVLIFLSCVFIVVFLFGYFDDFKIKALESEPFVVVQEVEYHKRFWDGTQNRPEKWVVSVTTEDGENYR